MPLSWCRDVSYTIELRPLVDGGIVRPNIVKPLEAIGAAKTADMLVAHRRASRVSSSDLQIHFVVVCYHRMVCSGGRYLGRCFAGLQHFPAIVRHLQLVEVKCGKIVHEVTFHLTTKDIYLGAEDVQ